MKIETQKLAAGLSDLQISWIDRPEALVPLRPEWKNLADRVAADPFATPDWCAAWWRHFNSGRKLQCLIARENGALVAVLPFCLEMHWIGALPLRIARLAGIDPHCIIFQLASEAHVLRQVLQAALGHLIGDIRCDAVSFTPVSELSGHLSVLRGLCAEEPGFAACDQAAGSHVIFDLPDRFDEFLKRLSKKRSSQFRRDLHGLGEAFDMMATKISPDARAFDDFVHLHNQQWQAVGRGGHFVDWPGSVAFHLDVLRESDGLQLHVLNGTVDEDSAIPLASQFVLEASGRAHWRLPARRIDSIAERLSIGKVGLLLMIRQLIDDGVTLIEAGRGDYSYKLDYGGRSVPVHRLIVIPETPAGRMRLQLLLGWSDLLNLLYYRVWFLKLAPRLRKATGGKPRPLWRLWIRSRL